MARRSVMREISGRRAIREAEPPAPRSPASNAALTAIIAICCAAPKTPAAANRASGPLECRGASCLQQSLQTKRTPVSKGRKLRCSVGATL